jgi:acetyltransferase-like isoleucine patch superfamily enzyme
MTRELAIKLLSIKSQFFLFMLSLINKRRHTIITFRRGSYFRHSSFKFGLNSEIHIGENVTLYGRFNIGDNCSIDIGDNVDIRNYSITLKENSRLVIKNGVKLFTIEENGGKINIDTGNIFIDECSFIGADIFVRFGGKVTIGKYSGFSFGTEIVCDENISIGDYCMFSYNLNIYDTNSHSTDWRERRISLENRGKETIKPTTKPVRIGNDVWIGKNSSILKGTTIGNRCIVGMDSKLVAGVYPSDTIIVSDATILTKSLLD